MTIKLYVCDTYKSSIDKNHKKFDKLADFYNIFDEALADQVDEDECVIYALSFGHWYCRLTMSTFLDINSGRQEINIRMTPAKLGFHLLLWKRICLKWSGR